MISIIQLGHLFQYKNKEPGATTIIETWEIERVAAFMFVVELNRQISQRYVSGLTFVNKIGAIQYQLLDFDKATNKDLNKLTALLSEYLEPPKTFQFHTTFLKGIDLAEKLIREAVERYEEPVVIRQVSYPRQRFLSRPTEEEYEKLVKSRGSEETEKARAVDPGSVLMVYFNGWGVIPCIVNEEKPKYFFVDGYLRNRKVVEGFRLSKDSNNIVG